MALCAVLAVLARAWVKREQLLVAAALDGRTGLWRVLMRAGVRPDGYLERGWTLLHVAAIRGDMEMLRIALDHGIPVDAPVRDRGTALITASGLGHHDIVRALLAAGANVEARAPNGDTPLGAAVQRGRREVAETLIRHGADCDAGFPPGYLFLAASEGRSQMYAPLVACGADVNVTRDPYTVLMLAARAGDAEGVRFLLQAGADPNASNFAGETALLLATRSGHSAVARILREAGAVMKAGPRVCDEWIRRTRRLPVPLLVEGDRHGALASGGWVMFSHTAVRDCDLRTRFSRFAGGVVRGASLDDADVQAVRDNAETFVAALTHVWPTRGRRFPGEDGAFRHELAGLLVRPEVDVQTIRPLLRKIIADDGLSAEVVYALLTRPDPALQPAIAKYAAAPATVTPEHIYAVAILQRSGEDVRPALETLGARADLSPVQRQTVSALLGKARAKEPPSWDDVEDLEYQ